MAKVYKKSLLKKLSDLNLDILGFPYKITFVKDMVAKFNITGCASVWDSDIQIDDGIGNLDTLSSILHEIIEVMFRKTETEYKHDTISKIETFMMSLIIENPELMEIIVETAKKEGGPIKGGLKKRAKKLVKGHKRTGRL